MYVYKGRGRAKGDARSAKGGRVHADNVINDVKAMPSSWISMIRAQDAQRAGMWARLEARDREYARKFGERGRTHVGHMRGISNKQATMELVSRYM